MTRAAAWVGAGIFTAGVSAALIAGAGTANADDDGATKRDGKPAASQNDTGQRTDRRVTRPAQRSDSMKRDRPLRQLADSVRAKVDNTIRDARKAVNDAGDSTRGITKKATDALEVRVRPPMKIRAALAEATDAPAIEARDIQISGTVREAPEPAPEPVLKPALNPAKAQTRRDPLEAVHDVVRTLTGLALNPKPQDYPKPVSMLGDVVFDAFATLERVVGGDPVVPPALRDSVEVSSSTLKVDDDHEVEANWYIPTTAGGAAPDRLIYLQHGFLANGPLYSYTASYLAHSTNSVVVTTTYTSNPFEADGMWLGGNNLHQAVAQLFLDPDRTALNDSLDAAEQNAGRTGDLSVPLQFVLVGHSLGGGFAPGVAGYYAEGLVRRRQDPNYQGDTTNYLAGVVTYDAVPMGSIMPDALDRLDALEQSNNNDPSDYVPIYEIGAPLNYLNVPSDINDQLSQARPGQFTGVVLEDGVHMDSMQGANPLIQFAAYVAAGFPQPQNPVAVRELSAGWINDMFDEKINPETGACESDCAGQYGDGDDSFTVATAEGDAVAVLIGSQRATDLTSLHAISVTDFISAVPDGVLNGLETSCDLFSGGACPV